MRNANQRINVGGGAPVPARQPGGGQEVVERGSSIRLFAEGEYLMALTQEKQLEMLRIMQTIRRFEERASDDYRAGDIYGVVHCLYRRGGRCHRYMCRAQSG